MAPGDEIVAAITRQSVEALWTSRPAAQPSP